MFLKFFENDLNLLLIIILLQIKLILFEHKNLLSTTLNIIN